MKKTPITLSLCSRQEDAGTEATTSQTHRGLWYERNGANYLLYDADGLTTTIRLDPEEIRLYRRGEMNSWQVFQLGELTGGLLSLGGSPMVLRILTSHFCLKQEPAAGQVELHYEMWTGATAAPDAEMDVSLGKFALALDWQVEPDAGDRPEPELPPEAL